VSCSRAVLAEAAAAVQAAGHPIPGDKPQQTGQTRTAARSLVTASTETRATETNRSSSDGLCRPSLQSHKSGRAHSRIECFTADQPDAAVAFSDDLGMADGTANAGPADQDGI
jgi:hypothetical protein